MVPPQGRNGNSVQTNWALRILTQISNQTISMKQMRLFFKFHSTIKRRRNHRASYGRGHSKFLLFRVRSRIWKDRIRLLVCLAVKRRIRSDAFWGGKRFSLFLLHLVQFELCGHRPGLTLVLFCTELINFSFKRWLFRSSWIFQVGLTFYHLI